MLEIEIGAQGGIVKLAQERLIAWGYDLEPWGADGDFGIDTEKAVRAFQSRTPGLIEDGVLADKTWDALLAMTRAEALAKGATLVWGRPADPASPETGDPGSDDLPPTLERGSEDKASVELLQRTLNSHGFGPVTVDGDYGPGTEDAVTAYQESTNLAPDGIADPETWRHLLDNDPVEIPANIVDEHHKAVAARIAQEVEDADRRAVLLAAVPDIGKKEVPKGSNGGPEIAHIVDEDGPGKPPGAYYVRYGMGSRTDMPPWCAISVSYWIKVGLEAGSWRDIPFGNWFGGCSQTMKWAQKYEGCWKFSGVEGACAPGSAFEMPRSGSGSDAGGLSGRRPGHTGLVAWDNGDGTFTSIEGNTGDAVKSRRRKISDMIGFVHWWNKE
jgi:peptidoglycan hydrolase-like protein with peptidoglycan-binding domain